MSNDQLCADCFFILRDNMSKAICGLFFYHTT